MKIKIKTEETTEGFISKSRVLKLTVWAKLTAEEQRAYDDSGSPIYEVTTPYGEQDIDTNYIRITDVFTGGGGSMTVHGAGQLKEKEAQAVESLKNVKLFIENVMDYEIDKEYILDLEEPEQ